MADPGPYLNEQHATSRRYAIFEDDGRTGWLYLTAPDGPRPVADVWVYNRSAPPDRPGDLDRSRPPPMTGEFAGVGAVVEEPDRSSWRFRWSADGEAVA